MNKKRIDKWIPTAIEALEKYKIAEGGKIESTYRGQISAFGAAIIMGSFESAVAFYSQQGSSKVDRSKLLLAMNFIVTGEEHNEQGNKKTTDQIFKSICNAKNPKQLQDEYTDASIALKLAMNFFDMGKSDINKEANGEKS